MMKRIILTLLFYSFVATSVAQYCSCIAETKDEKLGTETKSGTTKSNDGYTLLIQKEKNYMNPSKEPTYFLSLDAASRSIFSNNLMNKKGKIELILKNKSKIILENAKSFYNPVVSGLCITFGATITKEQLQTILINPIVTFSAFGVVKTSFKEKKQREQQIIVNCLLSEDW